MQFAPLSCTLQACAVCFEIASTLCRMLCALGNTWKSTQPPPPFVQRMKLRFASAPMAVLASRIRSLCFPFPASFQQAHAHCQRTIRLYLAPSNQLFLDACPPHQQSPHLGVSAQAIRCERRRYQRMVCHMDHRWLQCLRNTARGRQNTRCL